MSTDWYQKFSSSFVIIINFIIIKLRESLFPHTQNPHYKKMKENNLRHERWISDSIWYSCSSQMLFCSIKKNVCWCFEDCGRTVRYICCYLSECPMTSRNWGDENWKLKKKMTAISKFCLTEIDLNLTIVLQIILSHKLPFTFCWENRSLPGGYCLYFFEVEF
jgi:hypothetical protein